ncbi:MAG: hypothetical protein A2076_02720 [Geobacteraceae bacterium GWC2_53_11]|nr:MAG: hypothetical protein A2076_02720 [Geobacteraceae bacterium GWC2_53_11]
MAEFSVQVEPADEDAIVVTVNGPATISNVNTLLTQLLAAFHRADHVIIDLHGVTDIDAAGLQLLCSSHRSSLSVSKELTIRGKEQPVIRDAAAASGQLRTSGCAIDSTHTCIWTGGTY